MIQLEAVLSIDEELHAELSGGGNINAEMEATQPSGVSSFNGQVGNVVYEAPVRSVNGQIGDVLLFVPTKTSDLQNDSGFLTQAPVRSVNGQTGDVVLIIPAIPTEVSAFENDVGYLTQHQSLSAYATKVWVGQQGFIKNAPVSSVNGQTGDVVLAIPVVPTKISAFENDEGYLTQHQSLSGYATESWVNGRGFLTSAPVSSVNGQTGAVVLNIPTVPTNVSGFNNDAGYLTLSDLPIYQGGVV